MKIIRLIARRDLMKASAAMAATIPAITASFARAQPSQLAQQTSEERAAPSTTLAEARPGPATRLSVERRGQVAVFGLHRPQIQNRVDPETFQALAKALYDYDHDPSLRAAVLFGHGDCFSRGIDVDAYRAVANSGVLSPAWLASLTR